jgi:sigma-B regulation protein RsbU (phosphoserine phosphatase)
VNSKSALVLVVEDDPNFCAVLQKRLAHEGYRVEIAPDGREGMKAIVTLEPDLVLSDWMMPYVDGLELCQAVKTGLGNAAPYFILLTARGDVSERLMALETGADDYLVKPCDMTEILSRVRTGVRLMQLAAQVRTLQSELAQLRDEHAGGEAGEGFDAAA